MINLDEINKTILELEAHDTTFATVEKLAWLYIVKDHMTTEIKANETTGTMTGGEFCEACSNVPVQSLIEILSEHMEAISVLYPKEYSVILSKIKGL